MIDKYRTGFPIPGDIPFEDLSSGQMNNHNVIKSNNTPDNRNKTGTMGGGKGKKRTGLFGLFKQANVSILLLCFNYI